MTYFGVTPAGEFRLPPPARAEFRSEEGAPADSLSLVFPDSPGFGQPAGVRMEDAGTLLFDGAVDEWTRGGGRTELFARSLAALPLDSEALPQNYSAPSLGTIFSRHIRPYGFTGCLGDGRVFSGSLSVAKGMSDWQAAAAFCGKFLHVTPRARGRVFDASGQAPPGNTAFGAGGTAYTALEIRRRYRGYYSEVFTKSGNSGTYVLAASDPEAKALGIRRRRYLSGAFADAAALLRKADRAALEILVTCPGPPPAALLSSASVSGPELGTFAGLTVAAVFYRLDGNGELTRLTLRPAAGKS